VISDLKLNFVAIHRRLQYMVSITE